MSMHRIKPLAYICVLCLTITVLSSSVAVSAAEDTEQLSHINGGELPPWESDIPIYIFGILKGYGIMVGNTTYVPFRDFCEMITETPLEMSWDEDTQTASLTVQDLIITAQSGAQYITANGRCFYVPATVLIINDKMMLPIKELADCFGVEPVWNEDWTITLLNTDSVSYLLPADEFYNEDDLYWLSRIIYCESNNQSFEGKIGVGNVVINRTNDDSCPDTIFDVIFDSRHGIQFNPVAAGTIYCTPSESSIIAAKVCLEGYNTVGDSLYFLNPQTGSTAWFYQTRSYVKTIGDHDFYI